MTSTPLLAISFQSLSPIRSSFVERSRHLTSSPLLACNPSLLAPGPLHRQQCHLEPPVNAPVVKSPKLKSRSLRSAVGVAVGIVSDNKNQCKHAVIPSIIRVYPWLKLLNASPLLIKTEAPKQNVSKHPIISDTCSSESFSSLQNVNLISFLPISGFLQMIPLPPRDFLALSFPVTSHCLLQLCLLIGRGIYKVKGNCQIRLFPLSRCAGCCSYLPHRPEPLPSTVHVSYSSLFPQGGLTIGESTPGPRHDLRSVWQSWKRGLDKRAGTPSLLHVGVQGCRLQN